MSSSSSSWSPLWRNQFVRIRPSPVSQHRFGSPVRTQPLALVELPSRREAVISPTTSERWAEHRYASDTLHTVWAMVLHCFPSTERPPIQNLLVNHSPIMSMHHIFCYTAWLSQVAYCIA